MRSAPELVKMTSLSGTPSVIQTCLPLTSIHLGIWSWAMPKKVPAPDRITNQATLPILPIDITPVISAKHTARTAIFLSFALFWLRKTWEPFDWMQC